MQVFISYAREDLPFAKQLVEDLADYDLRVWLDVMSIPHGANWDNEVQKGLDSSDLMLVLLSPASASSQNVADEWSYFIDKDKPIVPAMIAPCDVPFRLSRRQRVSFIEDYQAGFQDLLRAIGSPQLIDPDSTQRIRPIARPQVLGAPSNAGRPAASSTRPATSGPPPVAPEVGVRMLPVIWAKAYHWFNGMKDGTQGDVVINAQEIAFIPRAQPIITIPLASLISVKLVRSIDQYLKLTYYDQGGAFESMVVMGGPKARRKAINQEIVNLLKLLTRRSLD